MRLKFAAAIAALPFATTANAANIYLACYFQDNATGANLMTQLFTLKGDAIGDSYPTWKYDGIREWEEQFAKEPAEVRGISSYTNENIVGQFSKVAAQHDTEAQCVVTTMKDHALAWFRMMSAKDWFKLDTSRMADWRPDARAGVVAVSDWSGNSVGGALAVEAEDEEETQSPRGQDNSVTVSAPTRHKMTNAEADAKYAADMADYNKKLAEQQKQVDSYRQAQDDVARKKQEQKLQAERAAADYQKQLEAHAQTVRNQQLEYQKEVARPVGVANAVYRGFFARDCDTARKSATMGAGTSSTTRFKEVTLVTDASGCTVQGWWWNVAGGGTATRQ